MASTIIENFTTSNISLYTIPAAYTLAMIPHTYALVLMGKRFDVRHPRKMLSKIDQDQTLDAATKARIHRAEAATANNIESIGLFAAAVVAGNYSGLPTNTLNTLSVGYVISRIVYNFIYVNNNTELKGHARFCVWSVGMGCIMSLFVKAGNALNILKL